MRGGALLDAQKNLRGAAPAQLVCAAVAKRVARRDALAAGGGVAADRESRARLLVEVFAWRGTVPDRLVLPDEAAAPPAHADAEWVNVSQASAMCCLLLHACRVRDAAIPVGGGR